MAVLAAPLVGRGRELASLEERLAAAVDGSPGMVVVAGDAGAGKTRFVGEVMTRAEEDGWTVLSGACVELSDGAAVLAPVAEVLRQLARDRGDEAVVSLLDGPARWLAPLVPELEIEQDRSDEAPATQVLVSFHRLLRDVADESPVLLVLEDLHWADATTRDLLRHLAVRLYDERLLVVATVRTDDLDRRHPLRPVLAEVVRRPAVDRIDLGPLGDDDLAAHLAVLAGDEVRHEDLVAVVRRAGGNPFHAEELLAAAGDRLPPSLHDALRLRLDRLPVAAQQLLGEAAVLGATIDAELLTSVTTLDQAAVSAALRAALDDGVLVVEALATPSDTRCCARSHSTGCCHTSVCGPTPLLPARWRQTPTARSWGALGRRGRQPTTGGRPEICHGVSSRPSPQLRRPTACSPVAWRCATSNGRWSCGIGWRLPSG